MSLVLYPAVPNMSVEVIHNVPLPEEIVDSQAVGAKRSRHVPKGARSSIKSRLVERPTEITLSSDGRREELQSSTCELRIASKTTLPSPARPDVAALFRAFTSAGAAG